MLWEKGGQWNGALDFKLSQNLEQNHHNMVQKGHFHNLPELFQKRTLEFDNFGKTTSFTIFVKKIGIELCFCWGLTSVRVKPEMLTNGNQR